MDTIQFFERDMTNSEFCQMKTGFDIQDVEYGNPLESSERYDFVLMSGENFVGYASGLADQNKGIVRKYKPTYSPLEQTTPFSSLLQSLQKTILNSIDIV